MVEKLSISFDSVIDSAENQCMHVPISEEGKDKRAVVSTSSSHSFPLEIFPQEIRDIINAYLRYEGFNQDFICGAMFAVFAAAMGNQWEARFSSTMHVSPIIYLVLIGPPSSGKTPPLRQAELPLQKVDKETDIVYTRQKHEYDQMMQMSPKERKEHGLQEYPEKPIHKEILVIDSTIEKLFDILRCNPHGILMFVNELNKLVSNLNRYNKGSDEAYWIEFFDGNQVKYERKNSDDYINIIHPYISIIGGTQPGLLSKMFAGERAASGFTSRFLKIFPDITLMPLWKRERMPEDVAAKWEKIIRQVLVTPCRYDDNNEMVPQMIGFSQDALDILYQWEEHIAVEWENADSYMQGVCGKLKTYVVRFCLIIHVMRLVCEETAETAIGANSAVPACRLADYFLEMDKRVHNIVSAKPVDTLHQQLFDSLGDNFTTSDAISAGKNIGMSERTVKRFLQNGIGTYLTKDRHGVYIKKE